ncbi:MAG: SPOR domain-containing protein [Candidatus Omnitrophica bacterium]|nr:SPOR domain-containing protein [Candidatus Omnitrophota bacterium]
MNDYQSRQSQFELFPSSRQDSALENDKKAGQLKNLTVAPENIIVVSIVLIITLVVIFSFGVEKGKRLALKNSGVEAGQTAESADETVIVQENLLNNPEVVPADQHTEMVQPDVTEDKQEILRIPELERQLDNKNYTIQVASFKTEEYAKKEIEALEKKGFTASMVAKGDYMIVCVGRFEGKDEAKRFAERLKHQYNDYLVRRF